MWLFRPVSHSSVCSRRAPTRRWLPDMARLVVVGSGVAGLVAALEASRTHEVTVVTKSVLSESNTAYAQGGIAAALFPDDSVESHIADTIAAGAGLTVAEA